MIPTLEILKEDRSEPEKIGYPVLFRVPYNNCIARVKYVFTHEKTPFRVLHGRQCIFQSDGAGGAEGVTLNLDIYFSPLHEGEIILEVAGKRITTIPYLRMSSD